MTKHWWHGPLLAWDTETTGTDVENDRIVTACTARITPGTPVDVKVSNSVINPGIPVPDEAAAVHGWTTERVQAEGKEPGPVLDLIAADLALALRNNVPVIIANAPFDLTILDRELRRHRLPTLVDRLDGQPMAPIVDPMVIDRRFDKYRPGTRTLSDLCAQYGVELTGAHDAEADALGAARVVFKLMRYGQTPATALAKKYRDRRFPQSVARGWAELGALTLPQLHQAQTAWYAEQSVGLGEFWTKKAAQLAYEAELAEADADRADDAAAADEYRVEAGAKREEADELRARIETLSPHWPMRPAPTDTQPALPLGGDA